MDSGGGRSVVLDQLFCNVLFLLLSCCLVHKLRVSNEPSIGHSGLLNSRLITVQELYQFSFASLVLFIFNMQNFLKLYSGRM